MVEPARERIQMGPVVDHAQHQVTDQVAYKVGRVRHRHIGLLWKVAKRQQQEFAVVLSINRWATASPLHVGRKGEGTGEEDNGGEQGQHPAEPTPILARLSRECGDICLEEVKACDLEHQGCQEGDAEDRGVGVDVEIE